MGGVNQTVSGGIGGFLAFFLLACALWLLMRNMNTRLQNIKYDEELEQQRLAKEAVQDKIISSPAGPASASAPASDATSGPAPEPAPSPAPCGPATPNGAGPVAPSRDPR